MSRKWNIRRTINIGAGWTLHVDGQRAGTYAPNGSIAKPYKTVQDALTVAAGILGAHQEQKPGVSIVVGAGRYEENCVFAFPFPYGRLDISSAGGQGSVVLRSLEISPCATAGGGSANFLNVHEILLGHTAVTQSPLRFHRTGDMFGFLHNCRVDLEDQDVPLCIIGDAEGSGGVFIHFYNDCRLTRSAPEGATTPAILCHDGSSSVDFQGRLTQSGAAVPLFSLGNKAKLDMQDSSLVGSGVGIQLAGSAQATIIDSRIETGAYHGIVHTGSFPADGAMVLLDGVLFTLTTGQAVDATYGALVAVGAVTWNGALAGYGGIESKITVAAPALLKRLQSAAVVGYTPAQTETWNTIPADIKVALDQLAARVKTIELWND